MGLKVTKPFKTFTDTGFPQALLDEITQFSGRGILGNVSASGTEIINEFGLEHIKTGKLIIYTSADSVLQIAAHEKIVSVKELYDICAFTRKITLKDEWKVGRIIARPFLGDNPSNFKRTSNRHDYALSPYSTTYLDLLKFRKLDVIAIGKINDIFNGNGITESIKTKNNEDGMDKTIAIAKQDFTGLAFTNLVDFDMEYGHRRDIIGYGQSIEAFDARLKELIHHLQDDDLLILTADHGNDPKFAGTDHTRENVPVLIYNHQFKEGRYLGESDSFAVVGATIAENFKIEKKRLLKRNVFHKLR
jgi:phosphopentomutase